MDNKLEAGLVNGGKSEIEKKLAELEDLLKDLSDTDDEETWDEEEMARNERVLQFVLNSGEKDEDTEDAAELEESSNVDSVNVSKHHININMRNQNMFKLNAKTGENWI